MFRRLLGLLAGPPNLVFRQLSLDLDSPLGLSWNSPPHSSRDLHHSVSSVPTHSRDSRTSVSSRASASHPHLQIQLAAGQCHPDEPEQLKLPMSQTELIFSPPINWVASLLHLWCEFHPSYSLLLALNHQIQSLPSPKHFSSSCLPLHSNLPHLGSDLHDLTWTTGRTPVLALSLASTILLYNGLI